MATEEFRKQMIAKFEQTRAPDLALSSKFTVRPGNIADTEKVLIDIERYDEEVSPVVRALEGPTLNAADQFTSKEFIPPTINEGAAIDVGQLLKRLPGQTEYDATDVSWQAVLVRHMLRLMRLMGGKIGRNREWQASQILTTGIVQLTNENGDLTYEVDYKPKATHFPTAGIAWDGVTPTILADIESLADVIRNDGLVDANELWMGSDSFNAFVADPAVQAHYDNRRMNFGTIEPRELGMGAKLQGTLSIGNYQFSIITYNGRGILPGDPPTTKTKFLPVDKVVFLSDETRLDTVFGGIPRVVPVDPRFAGFLPDRVAVPGAVDMAPNIYATLNGKQTMFELESRPLLIPTQIDGYGCLDTGV